MQMEPGQARLIGDEVHRPQQGLSCPTNVARAPTPTTGLPCRHPPGRGQDLCGGAHQATMSPDSRLGVQVAVHDGHCRNGGTCWFAVSFARGDVAAGPGPSAFPACTGCLSGAVMSAPGWGGRSTLGQQGTPAVGYRCWLCRGPLPPAGTALALVWDRVDIDACPAGRRPRWTAHRNRAGTHGRRRAAGQASLCGGGGVRLAGGHRRARGRRQVAAW